VAALSGWRRDVFGADALRLCAGEVGLMVRGDTVEAVPL
jgi:ribonuclease D